VITSPHRSAIPNTFNATISTAASSEVTALLVFPTPYGTCFQRVHSRLEVFLALPLLLLADRFSGGLVSLPRGLILRLQLSENLVQRPAGNLATESGR